MTTVAKYFFGFLLAISIVACGGSDEENEPEPFTPVLTASPASLTFDAVGGIETVSVNSNSTWSVSSSESWCKSSVQSSKANSSITISAETNYGKLERNAVITITSAGAADVNIAVSQSERVVDPKYTEYIEPDNTGMENDAKTLASQMYLGWNIVNTLEAIGGETAWGNPKVTNDLIVAVKAAGFNAIRIPCSWNQYLEEDETYFIIKESWLERVKEVVDYCVANDVYVVLNIHWDGGWMENNCTTDKQAEVDTKLAAIWQQIAIYFRDYDEHLLLAGANEPNVDNTTEAAVLATYMQTFVDVVRATGGRNTYRNLIVQAPSTDIDKADNWMTMPEDNTENRLFAEVHYYTPWQFCGLEEDANWGNMYYFWGTPNHLAGAEDRFSTEYEEDFLAGQFQKMKTRLVDKGVPVILGEFGAISRTFPNNAEWQKKHDDSRAYFFEKVAELSKNNGLVPFLWDNGMLDRYTNTVSDEKAYNALLTGAGNGTYPF
ncbi:cellulase family glycosylhydrolase [uncultured Draconibacterium sp.]|uniref:cellulase family glycosylhydrolase n=1 Tax=uncultured Draconibacterium sp. TaxID=1573823 RepID=UPI003216BCA8